MTRHAFLLRVAPEYVPEYIERHRRLPAGLVFDLRASGWESYSIFLDRASGLLVGFVDAEDFEGAQELMAASPANGEWDASMNYMFVPVDAAHPVGTLAILERVFSLDEHASTDATDQENAP